MRARQIGRYMTTLLAAVALVVAVGACKSYSSSSSSGDSKTIRIGYFPDISPLSLMMNQKLLEKMGYKVTYINFLKGIPQEVAAMVSGSVDMIYANASASIAAFSAAPDLGYLVGQVVTNDNQVVARKDSGVNSVADLEGRNIATSGDKTAPGLILDIAMRKAGKDIDKVNRTQLGGTESVTTMQQKAVDAAATYLPFGAQMILDGGKLLVTADEALGQPFPGGAMIAKKSFADANPQAVTDVLKVTRQATDELRPRSDDNFKELAAFAKTSVDSIKYSFDHNLVTFADSQVPNMDALQAVAKAEMEYGFVDSGTDLTSFLDGYVKTSFAESAAQ